MAKGEYKKWLEPENIVLMQGWKRNGLTDEQIANNIGVAPRTFERWKAKYSQISRALKISKEQANFIIENELFKKARSGDNTAMIFYLKNNWRSKYTDDVTDPELRKAQIRKANAEADIAEAKAKRENNGDSTDNINVNIVMPNSSEEHKDNE